MTRNGYLILLLVWGLLYSCSAFAGTRFGGLGGEPKPGKKRRGNNKGGASGNNPNQKKKPSPSSLPEKKIITLGPNKSVEVWVPPNALEDDRREITKFTSAAASASLLQDYASYRGTGDVIWPSALHLSRLVANCPSFVTDRRVLDLGCGLGLASLAALLGNPSSLALSDIDEKVLDWAMKSCEDHWSDNKNNDNNSAPLQRLPMDWSDPSTWTTEKGSFDVVLASDVLYDTEATEHVAKLIAHVLLGSGDDDDDGVLKRALIVDPANRLNRDSFVAHSAKNGLLAAPVPFPGQEKEFVLINVTPLS